MNPLISVIIPAYNRAHLIEEAVNSVLNQTYQDFEILIIDDGSSDNTKQVVENFKDQRIRYIYQNNAGPSAARNNGIKNAEGEYIAFLDSDDLWAAEKLSRQFEIIRSNTGINLGIISCNAEGITFDNKILYRRVCSAENSAEFIKGFFENPDSVISGTPAFIVKKECFEKVGYFDENLISLEDWDMWFRVCLEYEFRCVNEVLTYFRTHNSLSVETPIKKAKDSYLRLLDKIFSSEKLPSEYKKVKNKIYSDAYFKIALWGIFNQNRDINIAREFLLKSIKKDSLKIFKLKFIATLFIAFSPSKITEMCSSVQKMHKEAKLRTNKQ